MKLFFSLIIITFSFSITTEDIYDNSYALIIGIDKYQNVRGLDYAVKDAVDIQTMLIDIFHFKQDNIVLLQNEEATRTNRNRTLTDHGTTKCISTFNYFHILDG